MHHTGLCFPLVAVILARAAVIAALFVTTATLLFAAAAGIIAGILSRRRGVDGYRLLR